MTRPKGLCAPWPPLLCQLKEISWGWGSGDQDRDEPLPVRCLHHSYKALLAALVEGTSPLIWACLQRGKTNPAPAVLGIRSSSPVPFTARTSCCAALYLVPYLYRAERGHKTWGPEKENQVFPLTLRGAGEQRNSSCSKATRGLFLHHSRSKATATNL